MARLPVDLPSRDGPRYTRAECRSKEVGPHAISARVGNQLVIREASGRCGT